MFGYVQPLKGELKVREFEMFKSYYCSLCKYIGKRYGKKAQFLINYDCAFLGLLLDALEEKEPEFYIGRCAYNPLKKKRLIKNSRALEYAADINMMLAYYKLRDDFQDNKSLKSCLLLPLFSRAGKKTAKRLPRVAKEVKEDIETLSRLEREHCENVDAVAAPTAQMLQEIFYYGSGMKAAGEVGFNLGRWVYLIDAADDVAEDVKSDDYNVFVKKYGKNCLDSPAFREEIAFSLQFSLAKAAQAYEMLDIRRNQGILNNIIYAGVLQRTDFVLNKRSCENESI